MTDFGTLKSVDKDGAAVAPVSRDPQRCPPASEATAHARLAIIAAADSPQLIPWSRHAALSANGIVCALARRQGR